MSRRLIPLVLAIVLASLPAAVRAAEPCSESHTATDATVTSFDGTKIAITVFKPACAQNAAVLLSSHGWAGSRAKTTDQMRFWLDNGFGVVSIDARGHGDSGGLALIHHPDREIRDFRIVLDWIYDNQPWVRHDVRGTKEKPRIPKDIVVGAMGGSYGGGYQLLTAAFDRRLDAIVPEITWNNLPAALAPNGAVKSDWVALLYGAGKAFVDLDPKIDQWFATIMALNRVPDDAAKSLTESSPSSYIDNIRIPTLLVQGVPDALFNLNQAVANYEGIKSNGTPVWLIGHNSGHLLPAIQPTGLGASPRGSNTACGDIRQIQLNFYNAYLNRDRAARTAMNARPGVALSTEQGGCITSEDWPINTGETSLNLGTAAVVQTVGSVLLPLYTASATTTFAGIPSLSATIPVTADDIFYASLVLRKASGFQVVDDQVTAIRTPLGALAYSLDLDLGGIATTLQPGEQLLLRLDGFNEQFITNGSRRPGPVVLQDLSVTLPVL